MKAHFFGKAAPEFDYSDIRPKGSPLKTSGGVAPGPAPLAKALAQIEEVLLFAKGRKLLDIEVHDIACMIADCVISGGIRRSAMISLFDKDSDAMMHCKGMYDLTFHKVLNLATFSPKLMDTLVSGGLVEDQKLSVKIGYVEGGVHKGRIITMTQAQYEQLQKNPKVGWWQVAPWRGRANNSAMLHRGETTREEFDKLFTALRYSYSGEPAFYWIWDYLMGANPCVEIALMIMQFCNLCEINAGKIRSKQDYLRAVRCAAIIGTLQASYTNFHYLRDQWRINCEKEALLGIGVTGIASGNIDPDWLEEGAALAKEVNAQWAQKLGINPAARITCVKPSGTTSCVLGTSSGIHAWHDRFFIRRMRIDKMEAIYPYLKSVMPAELLEDELEKPDTLAVLSIPIKAPQGAIVRDDEDVFKFLDRVMTWQKRWVSAGHRSGAHQHNVSATINVREEEWDKLADFLWDNRLDYAGLSVLPYDGGMYRQAPFESIDEATYERLAALAPKNFDLTQVLESADATARQLESACAGGACEA